MHLLFWTKEAKADRLMSKLEKLYHTILCEPKSDNAEIAKLQAEARDIELNKISHTHYLLRKEHPDFNHDRLPLSPGIVKTIMSNIYYETKLVYNQRYTVSSDYSLFFNRALSAANLVHTDDRLQQISEKLEHRYTSTDAIIISDYLEYKPSTKVYYYTGTSLTKEDLEPIAYHYKVDIHHYHSIRSTSSNRTSKNQYFTQHWLEYFQYSRSLQSGLVGILHQMESDF